MTETDQDIATDEEIVEAAMSFQEGLAKALAGRDKELESLVDVSADVALLASAEPDYAFIDLHKPHPVTGQMMRLKIFFNEVDDPAIGFAYHNAMDPKKTTPLQRKRIERRMWRACVKGSAKTVDGKETVDTETIHSERFYDAMKPQARASLSNHCLLRVGAVNRKWAGFDQTAYLPAGSLVLDLPGPLAPAETADSTASDEGSEPTEGTSTASSTSATSPAGTESAPPTSSPPGPHRRSRARGPTAPGNA